MKNSITVFQQVQTKEDASFATKGTSNEIQNLDDLAKVIKTSGWSHIIWEDDIRSGSKFKEASYLGLDFDKGITRDQLIARLQALNINYLLTYSQSHLKAKGSSPACDRLRVVLPLKEKIQNKDDYETNIQLLQKLFPEMDMNTKDLARMWFPSRSDISLEQGDLVTNKSNFFISNFPQGICIKYEKQGLKIPRHPDVEKFIEHAQTGLEGEWNNTLNTTAYQLGILQNNPILVEAFISDLAPYPLDSSDLKTLKKSIQDGRKAGIEQKKEKKKDFLNLSYEILKELFHNRFHIFQDNSSLRKILEEYLPRTVRRIEKEPMHALAAQKLKKDDLPHAPRKVKEAVENFILQSPLLEESPAFITFKSDERLSFQRLDFDPIPGESPLFDELCSRCSNPEILKAFIWSIFEENSYSQQYLWLYGNGKDGKSSISNLLYDLCESVVCSPFTNGISGDKHYTAFFLDKRLAIFNDVGSRDFVRSDILRSLTGSDPMQINPKGEKAYTVKLNLKIFITSNKKPSLSSQSADQRRLLFCELRPFQGVPDVQYTKKLWEERAAILSKCRDSYFNLTKHHGEIRNSLITNEDFISDDEDSYQGILDQNFKLGAEYKMKPEDLALIARKLCKENDLQYQEFKAWLFRNYPLIPTNEDAGTGKRRRIIKGIVPLNTFYALFLIPMIFLSNI